MKYLSQGSWSLDSELNQGPPEFKDNILTGIIHKIGLLHSVLTQI
jgi:hypothetical protein